jgi:hypothetical protein
VSAERTIELRSAPSPSFNSSPGVISRLRTYLGEASIRLPSIGRDRFRSRDGRRNLGMVGVEERCPPK